MQAECVGDRMGQKEESPMLRLSRNQPSLWESILPPELFQMSEELSQVGRLLDDERFFAPFRKRFYTRFGRPTIPIATYLRMMYLKHRYELGYETLVKEVKDSFTWRCFCHLSLEDRVPDDTTLIKLTHKYGEDSLRDLNDALVLKLKERKVIRGKKLRLDTTVAEADIHYPTDTGLLADGVRVITRTVTKLKKLGAKVGGRFVNHTRKVKKTCLALSKVLKERVSRDNPRLLKAKEELIKIASEVVASGQRVKAQIEALSEKPPEATRLGEQLGEWLEVTEVMAQQTEAVLGGHLHIPHRLVSIFDVEARPIRRGKARADTEFGRKVLIGETDHGIITTYQVLKNNPSDTTLLKSGVRGHKRLFRKRLRAVAADRGFYSGDNEEWLRGSGVIQVSIPVRGRASKERRIEQKRPWFKRLQRFRAGIEARISLLQRKFGLKRSLMRGSPGTEIWISQGILTHNLWQAARIT
jgi:IS5 family transposase